MPLRKSSGTKTLLAGAVTVAVLAAAPATASAAWWSKWVPASSSSSQTTTTTTPAPAPAPAPAPPAETSTSSTATSTATTTTSTPAPADGCVEQATVKAYAAHGDNADYVAAPGATFEGGQAGWTFSKKTWPWDEGKVAKIIGGNDAFNIVPGGKALQVEQDGYATSPRFCVDESHPHFRFSFKVTGWATKFDVLIIYRDLAGKLTDAQFVSSRNMSLFPGQWQISPASPLASEIPLVSGGNAASVQIHAKVDNGTVLFDNFMVDPYRRR